MQLEMVLLFLPFFFFFVPFSQLNNILALNSDRSTDESLDYGIKKGEKV